MNKEAVFNIITQHTSEIIPRLKDHKFQSTDSLRDLGANSIDRSEIIMMTLESLSLNVPLMVIARAENIGEIASIHHEKL
jgi:polyketide biosynthesis acyl carrier protein